VKRWEREQESIVKRRWAKGGVDLGGRGRDLVHKRVGGQKGARITKGLIPSW